MANNDLQNITKKTNDRATRTIIKTLSELGGSGRINSKLIFHECAKQYILYGLVGLWYYTPLATIFQSYRCGQF